MTDECGFELLLEIRAENARLRGLLRQTVTAFQQSRLTDIPLDAINAALDGEWATPSVRAKNALCRLCGASASEVG